MNTDGGSSVGRCVCLPVCPFLPVPAREMDWRDLGVFREGGGGDRDEKFRGERFYETALLYGQSLWTRGYAARAVLCLDRAFGADLRGDEEVLSAWPLPYQAMAWFLRKVPQGVFIGNPRMHFQHYAGRMNEPRREQRRWRAWACWAIARAAMPELAGDARHVVVEPGVELIAEKLASFGIAGEAEMWRGALVGAKTGTKAGAR